MGAGVNYILLFIKCQIDIDIFFNFTKNIFL